MKKPLIIIFLSLLITASLFAQHDSVIKRGVILKINPLENILGAAEIGEIGGVVQIPITHDYAFQLGFGINPYGYNSNDINSYGIVSGYTIRGGLFHFLNQRKYISFQFSYRRWIDNNVEFFCDQAFNQQSVENADETLSNTNDVIINPSASIFPLDVNEEENENHTIDNAIINVYTFDFVYGKQIPLFHSKHFIFEYYMGGGFRVKDIMVQELQYQWDHVNYFPSKTASYTTWVPDVKLGIMIGFKL